jgi:hypothetical protein
MVLFGGVVFGLAYQGKDIVWYPTTTLGNIYTNYIIFRNVEIFTPKNSSNKEIGRKILNLQKYFIYWNEKFKTNSLFDKYVLKLPQYYGIEKLVNVSKKKKKKN